jgi:hypothetical protein
MPKKKLTFTEKVDKDHYQMGILDERTRVLKIIEKYYYPNTGDEIDRMLVIIRAQIGSGENP